MKRDVEESNRKKLGDRARCQDVSEFRNCFHRIGDVTVLGAFLNSTATWVYENFPAIELEVHQVVTLGCAVRGKNQAPDYEVIRARFPRLAMLASDDELDQILKDNPKPKDMAAGMLSRVLQREPSSIKRWAQGKRR